MQCSMQDGALHNRHVCLLCFSTLFLWDAHTCIWLAQTLYNFTVLCCTIILHCLCICNLYVSFFFLFIKYFICACYLLVTLRVESKVRIALQGNVHMTIKTLNLLSNPFTFSWLSMTIYFCSLFFGRSSSPTTLLVLLNRCWGKEIQFIWWEC